LGYVQRTSHPTDGRAKLLILTDKGAQVLPQIEKQVRSGLAKVLDGVTDKELITYQKVLKAIITNTQRTS
jgi:DNA-binding MarR family transcriptional regulator